MTEQAGDVVAAPQSFDKQVPLDELERAAVTKALSGILETGVKGEAMIKALLSAKGKIEFSAKEIEQLKARQPVPAPR